MRREPQENRPSSPRKVLHQLLMLTPVGRERLADKEFERQANGAFDLGDGLHIPRSQSGHFHDLV